MRRYRLLVAVLLQCLALIAALPVKGLAHITGGGLLENVPRVLSDGLCAVMRRDRWTCPAIFSWLKDRGNVEEHEMHRTFNCGIGMVAIVRREQLVEVMDVFAQSGEAVVDLGEVVEASGDERVIYTGHLNLAD